MNATRLIGTPLSADMIAAMRLADSVSLHHTPADGGEIRLYLDRFGESRIYTAREQRLFPQTDIGASDRATILPVSASLSGYGESLGSGGWNLESAPDAVAFHMISSAQFQSEWRTVCALVKPLDVVGLVWTADNNTEIIRDAGLHCDEVRLTIDRGGKKRALSFLLAATTGRDNTARMIRRNGTY